MVCPPPRRNWCKREPSRQPPNWLLATSYGEELRAVLDEVEVVEGLEGAGEGGVAVAEEGSVAVAWCACVTVEGGARGPFDDPAVEGVEGEAPREEALDAEACVGELLREVLLRVVAQVADGAIEASGFAAGNAENELAARREQGRDAREGDAIVGEVLENFTADDEVELAEVTAVAREGIEMRRLEIEDEERRAGALGAGAHE